MFATSTIPLRTTATLRASLLTTSKFAVVAPQHRTASTTTTTSPSQSESQAQSQAPEAVNAPHATDVQELDWDTFLRLRRLRRRYNLVSSVFTSFFTTTAGLGYLANKEIDPTQTIYGMDPLVMFGLATIGCGAAGWLAGPVLGTGAFGLLKRRYMEQISEREREFLQHIKKNRADPSFQSFSNPVIDYYGEKIGSVKDYRQWLKDQRAYNRKSKKFL
ncbi:TIM23 complex component [Rhizina undulata]